MHPKCIRFDLSNDQPQCYTFDTVCYSLRRDDNVYPVQFADAAGGGQACNPEISYFYDSSINDRVTVRKNMHSTRGKMRQLINFQ